MLSTPIVPVYKLHLSVSEKERLDDLCKFGIVLMQSAGGRITNLPAAHVQMISTALLFMLPAHVIPDHLREMAQKGARLEFVIHPDDAGASDPLPESRWEKTGLSRIVLPS